MSQGHFKHSLWHLNAEMYFQKLDQMLQTSTDEETKKETSRVDHQKFLKDFLRNLTLLVELSNSSTNIASKVCSPANCTFESHQFSCPCLNAKEEILLQESICNSHCSWWVVPTHPQGFFIHYLWDQANSTSEFWKCWVWSLAWWHQDVTRLFLTWWQRNTMLKVKNSLCNS